MTRKEWQKLHNLSDEYFNKIVLIFDLFKAKKIPIVYEGKERWVPVNGQP